MIQIVRRRGPGKGVLLEWGDCCGGEGKKDKGRLFKRQEATQAPEARLVTHGTEAGRGRHLAL